MSRPRPAPLPRLSIEVGDTPSLPEARLADFLWGGTSPDRALFGNVDGSRTLVRSRWVGPTRWVEHFELDAVSEDGDRLGPQASDLVRFDLDRGVFAETGRWRAGDDTNLHRRAFPLPATMTRGASVIPVAGARATLEWCGEGLVAVGEERWSTPLLRLRVEQGGMGMHQWLAWGVGEVAMGRADGPFVRWLLGWEAGGERRLGGLPPEVRALELPEPDLEREGAEVRPPI